jgi:hypothetical protein
MEDQPRPRLPSRDRRLQRPHHQMAVRGRSHRASHNPPREKVQHRRYVQPPFPRPHAGQVRDPDPVRLAHPKPPLQEVRRYRQTVPRVPRRSELRPAHSYDAMRPHQPRHPVPPTALAPRPQLPAHPRRAIRLPAPPVRCTDLHQQPPVGPLPPALRPPQPGIVPAPRHQEAFAPQTPFQHPAHHRQRELPPMILHEFVSSRRSPVEKIPTAFFRMSRSILSRFTSRLSRDNSASGVSPTFCADAPIHRGASDSTPSSTPTTCWRSRPDPGRSAPCSPHPTAPTEPPPP